jgi:hypothetical protein
MTTNLETLSYQFQRFGERECVPASPLYGRLAVGIAGDQELLQLASAARARPVPNLFLAAVHYLLLKDSTHSLAAYYPDLIAHPRGKSDREAAGADSFPHFRAFCLEHADAIRALLETRLVQTNEVRRCACLLPAFALVARQTPGRDLALVEVGASAGLNLLWNRYHYDYGQGGQWGDARSPVRLACELRGAGRPPLPRPIPAIAYRIGLDLHPVDVRDADEALWLRALIWPEQTDRIALLEGAIAVARRDPPPLLAGDANDLLDGALARVPPNATVCVYHSFVLNQFSPAARDRFHALIADHGRRRDIQLIAIEWQEAFASITLTSFRSGARAEQRLANCDAHGGWLEWL